MPSVRPTCVGTRVWPKRPFCVRPSGVAGLSRIEDSDSDLRNLGKPGFDALAAAAAAAAGTILAGHAADRKIV